MVSVILAAKSCPGLSSDSSPIQLGASEGGGHVSPKEQVNCLILPYLLCCSHTFVCGGWSSGQVM